MKTQTACCASSSPKAMSFENLSAVDVVDAAYWLYHRPRKRLGYRTPHEVFHGYPVTSLN